jgi:Domain of unknown function (DUF4105)
MCSSREHRAVSILLCVASLLFFASHRATCEVAGSDDAHYLQALIEHARTQKLADERLWHLLLHYKPALFGGFESEADGTGFFFHPDGKVDPQGELDATLAAFFGGVPSDHEKDPHWQHPQCRFPARYQWLKTRLAFDSKRLREYPCPRFEAWRQALDPGSLSLIFASHYLSNPASMFGHTLLRLNHSKRQGSQSLLDYGINYAAITTTRNGFLYAILGITGGFEGRFASFPYYMKVQEYGNLESRDLWEYDLRFTQEQIDRLLRHLWELGSTYFRYFFFQENCSYHILSLLEVANPDLHLTDTFTFTVIPSDTVRLITQQQGLVRRVVYRPSILTQFAQKRRAMDTRQLQLLRSTLDTKSLQDIADAELDASRQALVLDAAMDIVQHQKLAERDAFSAEDKEFSQRLLVYRSQLGVPTPATPQMPLSSPPELGHGTSRLRLAAGLAEGLGGFLEVSYPSFHDLLDPEEGFPPHSQLELLTPTVRYYPDIRRLDLERFDAVRITSLSPIDAFIQKPSWQVNVGYQTLRDLECRLCHWFKAEVGTGVAMRIRQDDRNLAYAFFNIEAGAAKAFAPDFRLAPGIMLASIIQPFHTWKLHLSTALYYPVVGGRSFYYRNAVHQHIAFTRNLGLRIELNQFKATIEGLTALQIYF